MKFRQRYRPSWDIRILDPNTLSDEQAEYYYAKAIHEGADVEEYPEGSMGRLAVASEYVRFCQRSFGRLTEVSKPV